MSNRFKTANANVGTGAPLRSLLPENGGGAGSRHGHARHAEYAFQPPELAERIRRISERVEAAKRAADSDFWKRKRYLIERMNSPVDSTEPHSDKAVLAKTVFRQHFEQIEQLNEESDRNFALARENVESLSRRHANDYRELKLEADNPRVQSEYEWTVLRHARELEGRGGLEDWMRSMISCIETERGTKLAEQKTIEERLEKSLAKSVTEKYAHVMHDLVSEICLARPLVPHKQAESFILKVFNALELQDVTNVLRLSVAHDAKHSLSCMEIVSGIIADEDSGVREILAKKFGPAGVPMAKLAALMHDLGYAELRPGESKAMHAARSAGIFNMRFRPQMQRLLGLNDGQLDSFEEAVRYHSTRLEKQEKGGPNGAATLEGQPLVFLVRFADKADVTRLRLGEVEKSREFIGALERLYNDPRLAGLRERRMAALDESCPPEHARKELEAIGRAHPIIVEEVKRNYLDELRPRLSEGDMKALETGLVGMSDVDYYHLFSMYSVQYSTIRFSRGRFSLVLYIDEESKKAGKLPGESPESCHYIAEMQGLLSAAVFQTLASNGASPKVEVRFIEHNGDGEPARMSGKPREIEPSGIFGKACYFKC
ncbi:MAG: hypothetical protein PHF51_03775 [Candidatus ainarchaeum sp.]|nr:hypothetical protein [Candidatus ainarchaeum sp.]